MCLMKLLLLLMILFFSVFSFSEENKKVFAYIKSDHVLIEGVKYSHREDMEKLFKEANNLDVTICSEESSPHSILFDVLDMFQQLGAKDIKVETTETCESAT